MRKLLIKQQGAAIIIALLITSLIAIIGTVILERISIASNRTLLILNDTKKYLSLQGSIAWAVDQLNLNAKKPLPILDVLPIETSLSHNDNIQIQSTLSDAEGLFNLNDLKDPSYQAGFIHMLRTLMPTLDEASAYDIAKAITDWVSPMNINMSYQTYYSQTHPPYRAAHQLMANSSELRFIKGITPMIYQRLMPYVTALPATTPININTAPAIVLLSLAPSMSLDTAIAIKNQREKTLFTTIAEIGNFAAAHKAVLPLDKVTLTSNYFLCQTDVTVDEQKTIYHTLLYRSINNSKTQTSILWQTLGS